MLLVLSAFAAPALPVAGPGLRDGSGYLACGVGRAVDGRRMPAGRGRRADWIGGLP